MYRYKLAIQQYKASCYYSRETYQVPRFKDMAAYLEKYLSNAAQESHAVVSLMGVEPGQIEKDFIEDRKSVV